MVFNVMEQVIEFAKDVEVYIRLLNSNRAFIWGKMKSNQGKITAGLLVVYLFVLTRIIIFKMQF